MEKDNIGERSANVIYRLYLLASSITTNVKRASVSAERTT